MIEVCMSILHKMLDCVQGVVEYSLSQSAVALYIGIAWKQNGSHTKIQIGHKIPSSCEIKSRRIILCHNAIILTGRELVHSQMIHDDKSLIFSAESGSVLDLNSYGVL